MKQWYSFILPFNHQSTYIMLDKPRKIMDFEMSKKVFITISPL